MAEVAYARAPRFWGPRVLVLKKMRTRSQKTRGPENAERESAGPRKHGVAIYEFLIESIGKPRTIFEEFEAKGKKLGECVHYNQDVRRVCQRNYDEPGTAPELTQTSVNKFRTGTFLVIIDNVDAELKKRLGAYAGIAVRFGSLRKLKNLHR